MAAWVQARLKNSGIELNGAHPFDLTVHDRRFFRDVFFRGTLGFGESYMAGGWDAPALDLCLEKLIAQDLDDPPGMARILDRMRAGVARILNLQSPRRAFEIGRRHYDRGLDLFEAMLDSKLLYSCGYWKEARTLEDAQDAKCALICHKLSLKPGLRLLDIGCGFGGLARYAAEHHGVEAHGITVSRQQFEYAKSHTAHLPVHFEIRDYRGLEGSYDRVVSVGMFEHVGVQNYRTFFETVRRVLRPEGLFLLHSIGGNTSRQRTDPWIERYIFPNSLVPSAAQITRAFENLFVLEDWHNFGADYEKTLRAWHERFEAAWARLSAHYDERFHRMWRLYLLASAVSFKLRKLQLWQLVFSPKGVPGGYQAPR
ncbi:cyclopropane-fatty-acyl-phospholipid synthase [mine drainage metagenome]|uniref:Cyclopropane-fatty-acyl-phospholipid synthase n=1 Tax=mine drainage metagenome TaxID=410659 RepID=T1BDS1_9ZZZZ